MSKSKRVFLLPLVLMSTAQAFGQAPLRSPKADRPIQVSPGLDALGAYLTGRTLKIDQAVQLSLVTNHALALARAYLLSAQGRTEEAYAALNPTVGGAID